MSLKRSGPSASEPAWSARPADTQRTPPGALAWVRRVGLAGLVLCAAMFLLSIVWDVRLRGGAASAVLERGRLHLRMGQPARPMPTGATGTSATPAFRIDRAVAPITADDFMIDYHVYPTWWFVRLPLWIPGLLFAGAATAAWALERRRRRTGCCKACGYSLAGLRVTGTTALVCPECGASTGRRRSWRR